MKSTFIIPIVLAAFLAGVMLDHFGENQKPIVKYLPSIEHADGSKTLKQIPATKEDLTLQEKRTPGKITGVTHITIIDTMHYRDTLHAYTSSGKDTSLVCPPCPPVRVSLVKSIIKGQTRVTVSSLDSARIDGEELVLDNVCTLQRTHRILATVETDVSLNVKYGVSYLHDIGVITLDGHAGYAPKMSSASVGIGFGFNF